MPFAQHNKSLGILKSSIELHIQVYYTLMAGVYDSKPRTGHKKLDLGYTVLCNL